MAVAKLAPHLDQLRGRIGGTVTDGLIYYDRGDGPCIIRRFVQPSNPATVQQMAQRDLIASLTRAYGLLDSAQAEAWNYYGEHGPSISDRFGDKHKLSGIQWFMKVNTARAVYGELAAISDAPSPLNTIAIPIAPVTGATIDYVETGEAVTGIKLHVDLTPTALPYKIAFRITPKTTTSARMARKTDLRLPVFPGNYPSCVAAVAANATSAEISIPFTDYAYTNPEFTGLEYMGMETLTLADHVTYMLWPGSTQWFNHLPLPAFA